MKVFRLLSGAASENRSDSDSNSKRQSEKIECANQSKSKKVRGKVIVK